MVLAVAVRPLITTPPKVTLSPLLSLLPLMPPMVRVLPVPVPMVRAPRVKVLPRPLAPLSDSPTWMPTLLAPLQATGNVTAEVPFHPKVPLASLRSSRLPFVKVIGPPPRLYGVVARTVAVAALMVRPPL